MVAQRLFRRQFEGNFFPHRLRGRNGDKMAIERAEHFLPVRYAGGQSGLIGKPFQELEPRASPQGAEGIFCCQHVVAFFCVIHSPTHSRR